jgi:hypothetical protein
MNFTNLLLEHVQQTYYTELFLEIQTLTMDLGDKYPAWVIKSTVATNGRVYFEMISRDKKSKDELTLWIPPQKTIQQSIGYARREVNDMLSQYINNHCSRGFV